MVSKKIYRILMVVVLVMVFSIQITFAASVEEKRQSIRNMAEKNLNRLYDLHPSAQVAINNAVGYAVFSNWGMKFVVLGGGTGKGLAVNNYSGEEVFMKMVEVDVGLGLGIKKFAVIFVFESERALERFITEGWQLGGQATVAITDGVNGDSLQGAIQVSPDIWMYQLTERGLALELTGKGTKYYKDKKLN